MAYYFNIKNVFCYSGGTEATALFPMVAETLENSDLKSKPLQKVTIRFTLLNLQIMNIQLLDFQKNMMMILIQNLNLQLL